MKTVKQGGECLSAERSLWQRQTSAWAKNSLISQNCESIGISLIHGIECCTPSFSLLISGGGAACVRRGCPHSNANSNTVPGVVFAKTGEAGCSGQPANVKTQALRRTYLCLRVLPSTMWEALESVTACQWQRDDLIQRCKIFFFYFIIFFFIILFLALPN